MMSEEKKLKPIASALGATFAVSLLASPMSQAADNPFTMTDHGKGYMVAAEHEHEGSCGEGKCGDDKKAEGKCGEGKCGDKEEAEGKCGEGKCGS